MNLIAAIRNNRKAASMVSRAVIVALMTVPTLVLTGASPALASHGLGGGTVTFTGTATLPEFPDPTGTGGQFTGTASGSLDGVTPTVGGTAWAAVFASDTMTASFTYDEPPECLSGTADGEGWIDGDATGLYGTRTVIDIHIHFKFSWVRIGTAATITTRATVDLTFADPPRRVRVLTDVPDTATAVFTPTDPTPDDDDWCAGGPQTATVVGTDLIVGNHL